MRLRQRRGTGINRKAVGAAVIAGVLAVGGLTGVQLASAGETSPSAADIIQVEGQDFDVSQCAELEINAGEVICDGEPLEPVVEQDAADRAELSAVALEAVCDTFAADQAAADEEAAGEDMGEEAATEAQLKRSKKALAKKAKKQAAEEDVVGVDAARDTLLQSCLDLAVEKAAEDAGAGDEEEAAPAAK